LNASAISFCCSLAGLQDTARLIELTGKLGSTVGVLNDLDETGVVASIGEAEAVLDALGIRASPVQLYHRAAYPMAAATGLSVTELDGKQKAAADVRELWAFLDAPPLQTRAQSQATSKGVKK
jgi:hypothetical protein